MRIDSNNLTFPSKKSVECKLHLTLLHFSLLFSTVGPVDISTFDVRDLLFNCEMSLIVFVHRNFIFTDSEKFDTFQIQTTDVM